MRSLKKKYKKKELEELQKKFNVKSIEPNSKNYFGIYEMLYYPDYREGHAYFERELEKGTPSLGHYVLAKILAGKIHNLAITTNFDSLIEDALFIYTDKRPLIIGHESLTEFINLNIKRPIIAKIHRSLYYQPFNKQKETDGLANGWQETIKNALMVYTPIVISYSGGDQSLMKFLKDESTKMNGMYWCYWNQEEPSDEIKDLVANKNGCVVPIEGFDQMMFMLSKKMNFENPEKSMKEITNLRIESYNKRYDSLNSVQENIESSDIKSEYMSVEVAAKFLMEMNITFAELAIFRMYLEKAIECYYNIIVSNPKQLLPLMRRGDVYFLLNQKENSIKDYNTVIELLSEYISLQEDLNGYYTFTSQNDEMLKQSEDLLVKQDGIEKALSYNALSAIYFLKKDLKKSKIFCEESINLYKNILKEDDSKLLAAKNLLLLIDENISVEYNNTLVHEFHTF